MKRKGNGIVWRSGIRASIQKRLERGGLAQDIKRSFSTMVDEVVAEMNASPEKQLAGAQSEIRRLKRELSKAVRKALRKGITLTTPK